VRLISQMIKNVANDVVPMGLWTLNLKTIISGSSGLN
jgi:hypothetical protein